MQVANLFLSEDGMVCQIFIIIIVVVIIYIETCHVVVVTAAKHDTYI